MRHIMPISGKDSAATAIVQLTREPDLPYEFLFCDVAMELPETYAWIDSVEQTLGVKIHRVGKSLEDVIAEQNMLPSPGLRFCTKYGKIFPIRDFIGKDDATQYIGIRADENRAGWSGPRNITPRYPLVELGIGIQGVYRILETRSILPPQFFWKRLYDAVLANRSPSTRSFIAGLQPWTRAMLFSWRSRSNCFMCFYQRHYEWVGLLEHHPNLFDRAEAIETRYGSVSEDDSRARKFYWIDGHPLSWIRADADAVFTKRVKAVRTMVEDMRRGSLFPIDYDPMTTTSCGLYCGK